MRVEAEELRVGSCPPNVRESVSPQSAAARKISNTSHNHHRHHHRPTTAPLPDWMNSRCAKIVAVHRSLQLQSILPSILPSIRVRLVVVQARVRAASLCGSQARPASRPLPVWLRAWTLPGSTPGLCAAPHLDHTPSLASGPRKGSTHGHRPAPPAQVPRQALHPDQLQDAARTRTWTRPGRTRIDGRIDGRID